MLPPLGATPPPILKHLIYLENIPGAGRPGGSKLKATSGGCRTPVRHTIPLGIVIFLVVVMVDLKQVIQILVGLRGNITGVQYPNLVIVSETKLSPPMHAPNTNNNWRLQLLLVAYQ